MRRWCNPDNHPLPVDEPQDVGTGEVGPAILTFHSLVDYHAHVSTQESLFSRKKRRIAFFLEVVLALISLSSY